MQGVSLHVTTEYDPLCDVIIGTGEGYHRAPAQVALVNGKQQRSFAAQGHASDVQVQAEFASFRAALEGAGITVHQPRLAPDTVPDQTCPRDIGFVIGDTFVQANMREPTRTDEIDGIRHILNRCTGPQITVPSGVCLEGGDVIVDGDVIFVGIGQRSDVAGAGFLQQVFAQDYQILPLPCRQPETGEDILHLDCTFNPLGLGHALIYPQGLADIPDLIQSRYEWIELTRAEADEMAANVVSAAPDHVIARTAPSCARVNAALRDAGYRVTEVDFDAVPATGGSFRCATLPLRRVPG